MDILKTQLNGSKLGLKGKTPEIRPGAVNTSKLHYTDSLSSSQLDLDGNKPKEYIADTPK